MKWSEMTMREKTERIVGDVMGWKYFPTWDIMYTARWVLEGNVTYPYAFWNDQQECISVFYQPLEDAYPFRPLESMDAAWQVFRHMMQTYYPTRDEWRGPHYPIFRTFADTLVWFDDRPMAVYGDEIYPSEYFFEIVAKWTPNLLCFAALKAVGVDVE